MRKKSKYIQLILVVGLTASHLGAIQAVYAQTSTEEYNQEENNQYMMEIPVEFSVALQVDESGPIDQSQIRFDIFAVENGQTISPPIYSYRHDDPSLAPLSLIPGQYVFRLYDGGQFQRNGFELMPYGVVSNNADSYELTEVLPQNGEIKLQSDGTVVYDFAFSVSETHLNTQVPVIYSVFLTTENVENRTDLTSLVSEENNQQDFETEESVNHLETEQPNSTNVTIQVSDTQSVPVAGVQLYIGDNLLTTDENGQASSNEIVAGSYNVNFGQLPSGYVEQPLSNGIEIIEGETNHFSISLESSTISNELTNWTIKAENTDGLPVEGVSILVGEEVLITDASGQVVITDLEAGEYSYEIISVPEGASPLDGNTAGTVYVGPEANNLTELTIIQPQTATASISLTFVDDEGTGVADLAVDIANQALTTDSTGQVTLSEVEAGTYPYQVQDSGNNFSEAVTGELTVGAGENISEQIQLTFENETANLSFRVTDSEGDAIPGVTLLVEGTEATTDSNGELVFTDLPLGSYTYIVNASPAGYQTGQSAEVNLPSEGEKETITLEEEARYGQITFRVVDQNEKVLPEATIIFEENNYVSNSAGEILITDILAGREYEVSVNPESIAAEYDTADKQTIEIEEGENGRVDLMVNREVEPAELTLNLADQNQEAVAGAEISLSRSGTQEVLISHETNAQGDVVFTDLEAGSYTYRVSNTPEGYTAQGTPFEITLDEGSQRTEYMQIVQEAQNGRAEVSVVDQDNQAVIGAQLQIDEQIVVTNDQGQAVFDELEVGDYQVEVLSLPDNYEGQINETLTILIGETTRISLQVEKQAVAGRAEVSVVDQEDQAVVGAQVQVGDQIVATNEAGLALFEELAAGSYQVKTASLPEGYAGLTDGDITIHPEETANLTLQVEQEIERAEAIVTVVDQNQEVVSGAQVQLAEQSVTTNEEGQARFPELAPGSYQVTISDLPEGYTGLTDGDIYLPEGEPTATLTLIVEREVAAGNVELTFVDEAGQGISGLEISIAGQTQVTDTNGQVNFNELAPGQYDYQITGIPQTYQGPESGQINVIEGESSNQTIEFAEVETTQDVELIIKDTQGQTIPNVTVRLGNQTAETNSAGVVNFTNINTGNQEVVIEGVPVGYEIQERNQTIQIAVDSSNQIEITNIIQTQTDSSVEESEATIESTPESASEPRQESTGSVSEATRRYLDNNTGIEIFLNPADAQNVVRLNVKKVDISEAERPKSLQGMEADIYEIQLLDRANNLVELSRVAQVKLPTRPLSSQLNVLRVNGQTADNLSVTVHNQIATLNTQQLGTYALVYGRANQGSGVIETSSEGASTTQDEQTSVSVTKTHGRESTDQDLPGTGESSRVIIYLAAGILVIAGVGLVIRKRRPRQ